MTVTIEVKPEIAQRWQEIAEREGRALETLLAEAMEERAAMLESEREYSQDSPAIRFSRDRATRRYARWWRRRSPCAMQPCASVQKQRHRSTRLRCKTVAN